MNKISWKEWQPGLENDGKTLKEAIAELPGNDPQQIHLLVKLFENPESPIAFKGAINLERHDVLHILLGRGLLPQDEAFVIGFTMGTSKDISWFESWLFQKITKYLYPHPYKFDDSDLAVFRMAVEAGKSKEVVNELYAFPFERFEDFTLGELRKRLGIEKERLLELFRKEKTLLPNTPESARLPA